MATGYTMPLHDGEPITFEQFALRCSRAMGAAIMQRDESPDVEIREIELDDYHRRWVVEAEEKLAVALARTEVQWQELQVHEHAQAVQHQVEYVEAREAIRDRYTSMLRQVEEWTPPSTQHEGLKEFMVEQLTSSIAFDCGDYVPTVPELVPVDEYRTREIAALASLHARYLEELEKAKARVATQNRWVRDLHASLT